MGERGGRTRVTGEFDGGDCVGLLVFGSPNDTTGALADDGVEGEAPMFR